MLLNKKCEYLLKNKKLIVASVIVKQEYAINFMYEVPHQVIAPNKPDRNTIISIRKETII